jgi:hypothetical protein
MPPVEGAPGLITSTRVPTEATPNAPSEAVQVNAPPRPTRSAVQGPAQHPISTAPDIEGFKNAGEDLERYLQFFESEYQIPTPQYLIAVYFASSRADLEKLARTLHGIQLPSGSLGYSFPADQSMVGWADGKAYGTFAHELFHLTVRNGFGDIPPWLDEGMAALYEVSRFEGSRAVGLPNWRGEILRRLWAARPNLRALVQMNRSSFDDASGEAAQYVAGERQALNHATARYFMLYLQQQGRLLPVYTAFQSREVNGHPAEQAIALLESTLHSSLDAVDADFSRWFQQLPQ